MAQPDAAREGAHLVGAFASRVAGLQPEAWDRIGARCAILDGASIVGVLGRAELLGRALTPDTDPYSQPFLKPVIATLGTLGGLFAEVALLFGAPEPGNFERAADRQHAHPDPGQPQLEPFLRLVAAADRQRPRHPGTASALYAVAIALLARRMVSQAELRKLYAPFEPEISFASLVEESEQHTA
jgi:hypothetical protein